MYLILEKNLFPGVFEPMATCWLQAAELEIGGLSHYHQGAARIDTQRGTLWLYPLARAQQIVECAERQRPNTEHNLIAYHPGTITPFPWSPHG